MRFIAYSDIHHDYYTNGLTLDDTILIEDQITDYAIQNYINTVFFLGDWYRATNPPQQVIKAAEASWKRRCDSGIATIVLVGNHDRETKAIDSKHAFEAVNIFKSDLSAIVVFDEVNDINLNGLHFLCIPSGHENNDKLTNYQPPGDYPLVVLFHGLLSGSALANGATASGGLSSDILRKLQAKFILGGDNHNYQKLDHLLGCPSMYLGAPLQHNWGDRGQKRGFWCINYDGSEYYTKFIPAVSPRFVRAKIGVNNEMDAIMKIIKRLNEELEDNPGVVEITLIGKKVDSLNLDLIKQGVSHLNLRRFKLSVDRTFEKLELAQGISDLSKPEDKWAAYIANGVSVKELNPIILNDMGKWALQEAKRQL